MDIDKLVHMANRIGEFFQALPDRQEALDGVAQHLKKFWDPRMRRQILAHLDEQCGAGLLPLVAEALTTRRELLAPAALRPNGPATPTA